MLLWLIMFLVTPEKQITQSALRTNLLSGSLPLRWVNVLLAQTGLRDGHSQ